MGLARLLARKSLMQRPGRTLFSVLGIAVGIASVVCVFTLDHNTVAGLKLRYDPDWRPDVDVRPRPGLESPRERLRATAGVADTIAFFQNEVVLAVPRGAATRRARLLAIEARALPSLGAYQLSRGRDLTPGKREVLLGERLASALGVEPGDTLELSRPRRAARKACIDGEIRTISRTPPQAPVVIAYRVAGVLAREKLGRRAQGEIAICDHDVALELFRDARIDTHYWIRRDPSVDLERLQSDLAASFAYDVGRSVVVGQAADERAFRNGVRMAGLLALVLGLYVIFHTLSMSLVERVREIGTLHALGASRTQVARIFLVEALALAGGGGVLGLAGGLGLARFLLVAGITTLGSDKPIDYFEVPWSVVLPLAAAGVAIALLGAIYPLLRARRSTVVEALSWEGPHAARAAGARGFHLLTAVLLAAFLPALYFLIVPVVGAATGALVGAILAAVGILGLLVVVPLLVPALLASLCRALARPLRRWFPFSGAMAAQGMLESPRRVSVATAALTLVAAAFVGLRGMTASLRGEVKAWAAEAVRDKVFVRDLPPNSFPQVRQRLHAFPGVLGVEGGSARVFSPFLILGTDVTELAHYGPLEKRPDLVRELERRRTLILSRRLARNLGYGVGDLVQVRTGSDSVVAYEVLLVSDAYGYFPHPDERMYGVVSDRWTKLDFCLEPKRHEVIALRLAPGVDPGVAVAAVSDALGGEGMAGFETGRALERFAVSDIDRDFVLFDILLALTALLAALGVLNGQLLAALERTKELGILKALGAGRLQIAGMVWIEALVVGLVGGLLGCALGSGLAPVIVWALEGLSGLDLPVAAPGPRLALVPLGTCALTLFASLYPILRMNRMDPVRAVRTG